MEVEGRVAIVTGGGRGIGRATALLLAREGAKLGLAARNREEIEKVKGEVEALGGEALALPVDVRSPVEVREMVEEVKRSFGSVDMVVNNAGVGVRKPLVESEDGEVEETIDTNLKGVIYCAREALKVMEEGVIVNIASGAGKVGIPRLSVYCASKFGVVGFTEALAMEAPPEIEVYALCPGGTDTGMHRSFFPEDDPSTLHSPEEVASAILELLGEKGREGECSGV